MGKERLKRSRHWLGRYTAGFLFVVAALCLVLARHGKTLIWEPDGIRQVYTMVGYVGQLVRNVLRGERPPMLSFSLGQGMDVLTTCAYYGYTDPLMWLGAFFRGYGIQIAYMLIALLRAWLVGAFLGAYLRRVGVRDGWAVSCGALMYATCGYFVQMLGIHPYFLNGALYLPLLLIGIERVLAGDGWLMYTLVVALMLAVNFYFAFMNTVAAILYIVVRLLARLRDRGVAASARDGFTLLGGYLLGAALSAVVLLPIAAAYLRSSRLGVAAGYSGSMLRYGASYYRNLALNLFSPWKNPSYFTVLNYAPLALIGLLALPSARRGKALQLGIALLLCTAALCVPLLGKLLNGGAYVSNRWCYIAALFVAVGAALGLARLFGMRPLARRTACALTLLWAAALGAYFVRTRQKWQLLAPLFLTAAALPPMVYDKKRLPGFTARRAKAILTALLVLGCTAYAVVGYLPQGYNLSSQELGGDVYETVSSAAAAQLIDDDSVYRVNQGRVDDAHSLLLGYRGSSFYWSLVDEDVSAHYRKLYQPTQTNSNHLFGLGGGVALNALAAVKYTVVQEGARWLLPEGSSAAQRLELPDGGVATAFENAWALPLGYAYDAVLPTAAYDALPVEDKLQALTAFAVCDSDAAPVAEFASRAVALDYEITGVEGVELGDHWIGAKDGDRMTLRFDAPEDAELYLVFENIRTDLDTTRTSEPTGFLVETDTGTAEANVPNPRDNFYFPKPGNALCIGHGGEQGCDIVFERDMNYLYDALRIVAIPFEGYRADIEARREEAMTDVSLGRDSLSGRIAVGGDRVLQIAVPYSTGWRCWVDGVEQPVFRCGGMYMGVTLSEGSHQIEMRYVTPGLVPGAIVSATALLLTIALVVASRRCRGAGKER